MDKPVGPTTKPVIGSTNFVNVPVRVLPADGGGYQFLYDFDQVDVTCARAVVSYQLVEAPVNLLLTGIDITPAGPFEPFVAPSGLFAGFVDYDGARHTQQYSICLQYIVYEVAGSSDPQVINNPIKR